MITRNKEQCFTAESKQGKKQPVLTEEEWNRREQELIDRMLRAVVNEPEEPKQPFVKRGASLDGVFIPSSELILIRENSEFVLYFYLWV